MDWDNLKGRHPLRTQWAPLRATIMEFLQKESIDRTEFRPLSMQEDWARIEETIYQTFCKLASSKERPLWLWTCFKGEYTSVSNLDVLPETVLDQLVEDQETVWYFVNETIRESEKFWFYEGKIKTIQKVIEASGFDELYISSKKYEWLICINHHDMLIATGRIMVEKLRLLKDVLALKHRDIPKKHKRGMVDGLFEVR